MSYRILSAAKFANIQKMTGRSPLDITAASKNFKTLDTAEKSGIPLVVSKSNRDGHNFIVIEGPNGQLHHRTI